jgi:hypothetical protein
MLTEKLQEIMNSLITIFNPYVNICLYLVNFKIFGLLVFRFDLLDNYQMVICFLLNIR